MNIREVRTSEVEKVSQFLLKTMGDVYPFQIGEASLRDLTDMESLYINRSKATILAAFSKGEVIGTIALRPYDGRISLLKDRYDLDQTCEIIKCYVDKNARRQGVGTLLYEAIERYSNKAGYKMMYLHTHKFLPGGLSFWRKKGFVETLDEFDEWQTVHFEKEVTINKYE
ncbi:GNAT family N-acetyltransferase [Metabacillus niabensis]|uniref:GNAT family N-acetyltransferase n=1 Tax=Metabacillus niabensis TaxID=324854 RepID=UPI001CF9ADE0|nr:GNAT family N-acetyltransferase [Metabacillus niabensis]